MIRVSYIVVILAILASQIMAQWGYGYRYMGYPGYGYGYSPFGYYGGYGMGRSPVAGALRGALIGGTLGALSG
ncbi:Neuropeptide-like protein 30 family protein [Oesophagostomum dentatum]|uniref:Neuropeptide-like protein 30 family protein n=1 Tax=Oesophagostomum dentatum TaxID=61180 RepID=A0A0B1T2X7_OESDE|nr:Neuropeptide-like protein 30 family protein [Oesophagostomum dentatum]